MKLAPLLLAACFVTSPNPAAAAKAEVRLVAGLPGEIPADRPVNARLGEAVTIWAVVSVRERGRTLTYCDAPAIKLGRRRLSGRRLRPMHSLLARFHWSRVEPRPHHVNTPPPNKGNPAYSNAILFGPNHGKWIGYDTIEYFETRIKATEKSSLVVRRTHPTHPRVDVNGGLGTMRYQVSIDLPQHRGGSVASAGVLTTTRRGIAATVMRVTFRREDHWVGFLRGLFNVPNVFGSGGHGRKHQTDRYQGADCADVIVGALRAAGARVPYTSARGLLSYARPTTPRLYLDKRGVFDAEKKREVTLVFGREVRKGDIMLIDYAGFTGSPRSWDHVAVIDDDAGKKGRFDPDDPILHMGYLYGLTREPAQGEGPAYVQILRLKPRILRALKRAQKRRARAEARRLKRAAAQKRAAM